MMTISERYFDGTQSLAIKVLPEQYDSDPDIFISINNTSPTSSLDSQWFCVKEGSDTCIVSKNSINQGDTLYIGVRCINPCQYTLSSNYISEINILESNRTQLRLNGFSSTILSYLIPAVNPNGITRAVQINIDSEDEYNPIDLYFSLDSTIYQVEERKVENILSNGVGFSFTENDYGWCTGCYIYLLADVINDGRYYVTISANSRSSTITALTPTDLVINTRQQECVLYFVLATQNDLMLYSSQYQGDTDFYMSGSTKPTDYQDTTRILQQAQRVPHKCMILTAEDRARWGFKTGVLNVCAYAFSTSSIQIEPIEDNYGGRFDARNGVSYTFNIENNSSMYFRYTQREFNQSGNITVTMTTYNLSNGQPPPRLYYKVCPSSDSLQCSLSDTELRGVGMTEIASGPGNITNLNTRTATFIHNKTKCQDPFNCHYLINVFFPDQNGPMKTIFSVLYNSTVYAEVNVDETYKNILQQGKYFYYAILPGSSIGFSYLQSLTIRLKSQIGDADLVVSVVDPSPEIDQGQFEARGSETYDAISINNTGNFTLNRPIYIGVYAQTFCVYEIEFQPVYKLDYNEKLNKAVPITDSIAYSNVYLTEFEESFYSFSPWWAGYENRTMVFFADVTFNEVFFYLQANDYPMFYLTDYKDSNDIVVMNPGDPSYSLYNGYYIRIRPDFQLQDLISDRQYIFNFYVFSQLQTTRFVDIHLNENKFGYANQSGVFYRHFILENNATYNFSVIPIIGDPAILLKLSNTPVRPVSADVQTWDYKSDNVGKVTDSIIVSFVDRSSRYAFCDNAGYNLNGGNISCGFYVAVECTQECIFNVTVQIVTREKQFLPKYLIEDDYYTGQVSYNTYSYFYYPLNRNQTGEMVIILNKTGSLGKNGDSMILASLMSESISKPISNWTYPKISNYSMASSNYRSNQPEIIELCNQVISTRCSDNSCILMLGVLGLTPNVTSNFRIIVQKQKNKLYDRNPILDFIANVGDYDYYWFTSNVSAINSQASWEYQITVSADQDGSDVDLFVTALDGRFPVTDDYDFASQNLGADSIYVNSNSSFFIDAGYNKSNGILFMVGVKAITPNVSYTLMMTGPNKQNVTVTNMTTGQQIGRGLQGQVATNKTNYFKWFNWGSKDFRINIDVTQGNVSVYINFVGEEVFSNNGFQALPQNANNSKWVVYLNASQSGVLQVSKSDIGAGKLFCYYCWYFITVTTNLTGNSAYRISVNEVPDVGEEVLLMSLNTSVSLTLPATGTVSQRKFILDCKDPFSISAQVTTGYLIMYVGLYPESPKSRYQFYAEGSSNLLINVRQTDQNFKVGAFYYITLQSGQGRTSFTLSINQRKTVQQLESGVTYKDQYWNSQERIKLYYFVAPTSKVNLFRAVINIQSLSPDFYPTLLINKLSLTSTPSDFTKIQFPNIKTFNYSFGDNFFQIANQKNFTYQIRETGGNNTYFSIALYSFSYGMTDRRKPAFKITMTIDNKTLTQTPFFEENFANEYVDNYQNPPSYYSHNLYDDYYFSENSWEDQSNQSIVQEDQQEEKGDKHLSKVQESFQKIGVSIESYLQKAQKFIKRNK